MATLRRDRAQSRIRVSEALRFSGRSGFRCRPRRRRMLSRWRRTISAASRMQRTTASGRPSIYAQSGDSHRRHQRRERGIAADPGHHEPCEARGQPGGPEQRQKACPRKVATPLPPLKPRKTGKQWPKNAAKPANLCRILGEKRARDQDRDARPCPRRGSASSARGGLLPVRSTLVAPIFARADLAQSRPARKAAP